MVVNARYVWKINEDNYLKRCKKISHLAGEIRKHVEDLPKYGDELLRCRGGEVNDTGHF